MNYNFIESIYFDRLTGNYVSFGKKLVRRTINVPCFVVPWTLYLVVHECNVCAILVCVFVWMNVIQLLLTGKTFTVGEIHLNTLEQI